MIRRADIPDEVLEAMRDAGNAAAPGPDVPIVIGARAFAELREEARGGGMDWEYTSLPTGEIELRVAPDVARALEAGSRRLGCTPGEIILAMITR